jgi:hypothetical protein
MPTIDERLKQVTLKVKRAKEHIEDLDRQIRTFLESNPYKVGAKHDPESRKLIYYVASVEPIPDCLPLVAGDAVQNLMSALDHLAYQIVCSDTGDKPPHPNGIYFPIADNAAKYKATKGGKIKGARQETFDAIDALKPYKGGNDPLWSLYRTKEGMTPCGASTDSTTLKSTACCSRSVPRPQAYISASLWLGLLSQSSRLKRLGCLSR